MFKRNPLAQFLLGTYTSSDQSGRAKGIYAVDWDADMGRLGQPRLLIESENPSYLCMHPSGAYLYAVNENAEGAVSAFRVEDQGLSLLNSQSTEGIWPCHLSIDNSGRWLFVANYGSGSVSVHRLGDDGSLGIAQSIQRHKGSGPHKQRQEAAHAHMIVQMPESPRVYVVDLGLDRLVAYDFDSASGTLFPAVKDNRVNGTSTLDDALADRLLEPAAGPRHFALHPRAGFAYVTNELDGTLAVFYTGAGRICDPVQTIKSSPESARGDAMSAAIRIHPTGRFLYVSHRAETNDIAVFAIDETSGKLSFVSRHESGGKAPRDFVIDATGRFAIVANQHSDELCVFPVDQTTGSLMTAVQTIEAPTTVNLLQI